MNQMTVALEAIAASIDHQGIFNRGMMAPQTIAPQNILALCRDVDCRGIIP